MRPFDGLRRAARHFSEKLDAVARGIANQADLQNRHLMKLNQLLEANVQGVANQADLQNRHLMKLHELMEASIALAEANNKLLTQIVANLQRAIAGNHPISSGKSQLAEGSNVASTRTTN